MAIHVCGPCLRGGAGGRECGVGRRGDEAAGLRAAGLRGDEAEGDGAAGDGAWPRTAVPGGRSAAVRERRAKGGAYSRMNWVAAWARADWRVFGS
ncbi:hypothetical protein L3i22_091770 [Actinoplanes sp. L3-i22]|nr:hypothetical protein L3i22_091770 [Actinoplanes sp. L3-i22]